MTNWRLFTSMIIFGLCSETILAEELALSGSDAYVATQKTTCGTTEQGKVRYGIFQGRTYSRVPGEKDRLLFTVLGINVRHCIVANDEVRGRGFRSISREIMVYMDPETGEIVDTWRNPWTGKDIKVQHVANDPVNMRAMRYERDENGASSLEVNLQQYGDIAVRSAEIPLFYDNPLGGQYQSYVGGTYHAMEIFNSFYDAKRLLNNRTKSIGQSHMSWSRVAQWLPWLEMGSKPGLMVFNANGFSTFDKNEIPAKLMSIIEERYPLYAEPPPLDDNRANETSWTVFKKYLESLDGN